MQIPSRGRFSIGWFRHFRQDLEVDFPRETAEGLAHREQVLEVVSGGISGFFPGETFLDCCGKVGPQANLPNPTCTN